MAGGFYAVLADEPCSYESDFLAVLSMWEDRVEQLRLELPGDDGLMLLAIGNFRNYGGN